MSEEIRDIWGRFIDRVGLTPAAASKWIAEKDVGISAGGVRSWFGLDGREPSAPRDGDVETRAIEIVDEVLGAEDADLLSRLWAARRAMQRARRDDLSELDAVCSLGVLYQTRGATRKAEQWYLTACELGNVEAMYNLAVLYEEMGQKELAEQWYLHAGEQGHPLAMNNVAVHFQEQGRLQDAETWYLRACEEGNSTAMANLAVLYRERGEMAEAERWLMRASELGEAKATSNLAALYLELGEDEKAEEWQARLKDVTAG